MVEKAAADVRLVVFVCEAGMGSSLIGANQLKRRVKDAGLGVNVIHARVGEIPPDADVVLAHEGLAERGARARLAQDDPGGGLGRGEQRRGQRQPRGSRYFWLHASSISRRVRTLAASICSSVMNSCSPLSLVRFRRTPPS